LKEKQFCILAVDDSIDDLELIKLSLEAKTQWRVLTSSSGKQALIQAKKELPDVILLDVQMPKIDGIEAVKKLRASSKTNKIPILLLTNTPCAVSSEISKELSIIKIIRKPSDWLSLADLIVL
jgi:CheY-like chemotaxis protein